jgi:hypothetical protein
MSDLKNTGQHTTKNGRETLPSRPSSSRQLRFTSSKENAPIEILIEEQIFSVRVNAVLSEKDDGFSGVEFISMQGKKFRLRYNRFSFVCHTLRS